MSWYCNVRGGIVVDLGDHGRRFEFGDEIVDVPESALEAMVRLKQALPERPPESLMASHELEREAEGDLPPRGDVSLGDRRLSDLGLRAGCVKALAKAGISTVGEALAYGAEHGSLAGVAGVKESDEAALQQAIEALTV